jgi:hypothetical protein
LHVAFDSGFSACGFSEDNAADVAGDLVHGVAEDELLVAAFGAFYADKAAAWFGNEFVPFRHVFLSLLGLDYCEFSEAYAILVAHVTANLAFKAQSLLLGGFGEFLLEGIFLSSVTFFFACVVAFAFCHGAAFAWFVKGHCVCLVSFTFWAVRGDFFWNVHVFHFPAHNRKH